MSHYGVNASVPEDADPVPDPLGRRARAASAPRRPRRARVDPRHRDLARARAPRRRRRRDEPAPAQRGRRRPVRAAGLPPLPRAALRLPAVEGRVPRPPRVGRPRRRATGPHREPTRRATSTTSPTIWHWLRVFLTASSRPASSSARRCPTGRRSAPAARCRRAATGARRATRRPRSGSTSWTPLEADGFGSLDRFDRRLVAGASPATTRAAQRRVVIDHRLGIAGEVFEPRWVASGDADREPDGARWLAVLGRRAGAPRDRRPTSAPRKLDEPSAMATTAGSETTGQGGTSRSDRLTADE